jgi:hypothetical protein
MTFAEASRLYLDRNPDVRRPAWDHSAIEHYRTHGRAEGRIWEGPQSPSEEEVQAARSLPGVQGWAARFSPSQAEYYAQYLGTTEGISALEVKAAQDSGDFGVVGKIVESKAFGTLVKSGIAAAGGVAGKIAVTAMAATAPQPYVGQPLPYALAPGDLGGTMFDSNGFDWSGLLQGGLNAVQAYQARRAAATAAPMAMPGSTYAMGMAATPVAWPTLPAIGGAISRMLPAVVGGAAGAVVRGGRMIATAIGNISRKRVVAIAKTLGIQGAATALGLGAVEIAQMVLDEDKRKGRRGGITGAQLRTTRRTIGKVERAHRQIVAMCNTARVPSRRRAARWCPPAKRR